MPHGARCGVRENAAVARIGRTLILTCAAAALGPAGLSAAASGAAPPAESCPPPNVAATTGSPAAGAAPAASSRIVACVGSQPITRATFAHWRSVTRHAERLRPRAAVEEVMGFLLSSEWVLGEARELGVVVSARDVRTSFDRVRQEQFPKRGELTAFLRSSGQTVADLLVRVKLNLLTERIQRRVVAGQQGATAQEQALSRFVSEFKSKWLARTYCLSAYAVSDCGHVQAVL
jgi:hypothetical protein